MMVDRTSAWCLAAAWLMACQGDTSPAVTDDPVTATDTTPTGATGTPTATGTTVPDPAPLTDVSTPVVGGVVTVLSGGERIAASDVSGDQVVIVDTSTNAVVHTIAMPQFSQPGRLAEGADGQLWVALRRAGTVASIDPNDGTIQAELAVCGAPRGLSPDPVRGGLWVACAGGELVRFDQTGIQQSFTLPVDLRDVVIDAVDADLLWVSRFRTADLLEVDADTGAVAQTHRPANVTVPAFRQQFGAGVAWRTVAGPSGGAFMLHQRPARHAISTQGEGEAYGGRDRCGAIVQASITGFGAAADGSPEMLDDVAVPVDFVRKSDGSFLVAVAGAAEKTDAPSSLVSFVAGSGGDPATGSPCAAVTPVQAAGPDVTTSVVIDAADRVVTVGHHPFVVTVAGTRIEITGGDSSEAAGFQRFHKSTGPAIACVSCHPEGTEDGHTWTFVPAGVRRTQSLGGGIMQTLPLHWAGEFASFEDLLDDVHRQRMSGPELTAPQMAELADWIDDLEPAARVATGASAATIAEGKAVFERASTNCSTCHAGDALTDNANHDVGTGGSFQTPSLLGAGNRLPAMHNGCAATLEQRFDPYCGGKAHGDVSGLDDNERQALLAYLRSL